MSDKLINESIINESETSKLDFEKETPVHFFNNWDELDLDPNLLRGIYAHGFEKPSPIQSKSIHPILQGFDLIAQAQSGTGKTASFSIGGLSKIDVSDNSTQSLVIVPTHELAHQITDVVRCLSNMMKGIRVKTIVGGTSIEEDAYEMRNNTPHFIVGTPGRVHDMIRRRYINANKIKIVILDEADEMLSSGFKDQVYNIFKYLNKNVQIALFSATFPSNIHQIANKFMREPVRICVKKESLTLEGIKQYFIAINDDIEKYITLKDLYQHISVSQCIIYCNSVKRVIDLYEAMKEDSFPVCCIHSNMDKIERERVFKEFRKGSSRVLISSNVTSRGIDIQQVGVVINFDIPKDVHNYLHRIGRSGRWGRKGTGINFVTRRDIPLLRRIEEYYSTQIDELPSSFNIS
jgi:translation initiation factor 4A